MTSELVRPEELGARRHLVVADRLRARRRDLGLTQKEVVARLRRMGVGTTNKTLSNLEHGAGLDACKLPEIAAALECTLTYLVGLTDDPGRWEPDPVRDPATASAATSGPPPPRPQPGPVGPRNGGSRHHDRAVTPAPRRQPPILGPFDGGGSRRRGG